jgi:cysteinyl-tRNA synthetase
MGFPGWHLECSAMSMKYLGESFDIHGGGIENQFPHHDDEIAQAEAATGKPFVKYWLHNNMVTVGGQKMGKSLGNFITLKDAIGTREKPGKWDPMVLRMFILQSHYRSPLDFSDEALGASREGLTRLRGLNERLGKELFNVGGRVKMSHIPRPESDINFVASARQRFWEALDDDFNTPGALAALFDLVTDANRSMDSHSLNQQAIHSVMYALDDLGAEVLGISGISGVTTVIKAFSEIVIDSVQQQRDLLKYLELVQTLVDLRNDARKTKNFAQADAIRKRLDEIGIVLEDAPDGTQWRFK